MKPETGKLYDICNYAGQEQGIGINRPHALIHEITEYKGQYICSGEKLAHQQRIPHKATSIENIPAWPIVFVVLPNEMPAFIEWFVKHDLLGFALALRQGRELLYIVNWQNPLPKLGFGPMPVRAGSRAALDAMLAQAPTVIDHYHKVKAKQASALLTPASSLNGAASPATPAPEARTP